LVHIFVGFSPWSVGHVAFGLWQGEHSGGKHMMEQTSSPHGQEVKKEKKKELSYSHNSLQRHIPMSRRPSTRFHLLKFPLHSNRTTMGTELLTHGSLGDIPDPNCSRCIDFLPYCEVSLSSSVQRCIQMAGAVQQPQPDICGVGM
jgi:hypothetical protein